MKRLPVIIAGAGLLLLAGFVALVLLSNRSEERRVWGYVDAAGAEVIPITFDEARDFSYGRAAVQVGRSWGFVDPAGELVITPEYELVGDFTELGRAWAQLDSAVGYLRPDGTWAVTPRFDMATAFTDSVAIAGMVVGRTTTRVSGSIGTPIYSFGIIDQDGIWIVEPLDDSEPGYWSSARGFSEGLAAVKIDGTYGYVNHAGELVIPAGYDRADSFHNGIALTKPRSGGFRLIDTDGAAVLEPGVSSVIRGEDGFLSLYGSLGDEEGWFLAGLDGSIYAGPYDGMGAYVGGRVPVEIGDTWFLNDADGNRYGEGWAGMGDISEAMVAVAESQPGLFSDYQWGYADVNGAVVIPLQYNRAEPFREGRARVAMKAE